MPRHGTLQSLVAALNASDDFSVEALTRIAEQNLPTWEEIEPLVCAGHPYGRITLAEAPNFEVMIGCWTKGNWCDAHDHGDSIGVCWAYKGTIDHVSYELHGEYLDAVERCSIGKDDVVPLKLGLIHSLVNTSSDEPFVGLHIYSPPTKDVRVFDLKHGDIYHVHSDQGAWIPEDLENVKAIERAQFTFRNQTEAVAGE